MSTTNLSPSKLFVLDDMIRTYTIDSSWSQSTKGWKARIQPINVANTLVFHGKFTHNEIYTRAKELIQIAKVEELLDV